MPAARNRESNAPSCPRNPGWMRRFPCRYWRAQPGAPPDRSIRTGRTEHISGSIGYRDPGPLRLIFGDDDAHPPSVVRLRKQNDQRVRFTASRTTLRMLLARPGDTDGDVGKSADASPTSEAPLLSPSHEHPRVRGVFHTVVIASAGLLRAPSL